MNSRIVEFKILPVDEIKSGKTWESTPVSFRLETGQMGFDEAAHYCDRLARFITLAEHSLTRWEFQGVGQGHYAVPDIF